METLRTPLWIVALILFLLGTFVTAQRFNLLALGLAFVVAGFLVGVA